MGSNVFNVLVKPPTTDEPSTEKSNNKVADSEQNQNFDSFNDYLAAINEIAKAFNEQSIDSEQNRETEKTKKTEKKVETPKIEGKEKSETEEQTKLNDQSPACASKVTRGQKVNINEDDEHIKIQIEFTGYEFKPEDLDVQLINDDILYVLAENSDSKFERKFKLPPKCQMDKIQPKFQAEEQNKQTLNIYVPKKEDVKRIVNIPIRTPQ